MSNSPEASRYTCYIFLKDPGLLQRTPFAVFLLQPSSALPPHFPLPPPLFFFGFGTIRAVSFMSSPFGLSCAEELQLILIKLQLSFRFINVTLASFLFINVTLTVNPNSLIIKVDGNRCSVCGQIASHQGFFLMEPDSLMQTLIKGSELFSLRVFLLLLVNCITTCLWSLDEHTWYQGWSRNLTLGGRIAPINDSDPQ